MSNKCGQIKTHYSKIPGRKVSPTYTVANAKITEKE